MASETTKGLPDWYSPGTKKDGGKNALATTANIKWCARLNYNTNSSPVVSQGRVFIGTAGDTPDDARIVCFDEQSGKELGSFVCGPSPTRTDNYGVCSTPTVEGDRLYFVAPFPEVMCLDLKSWLDPSAAAGAADSARHIVWRYDMAKTMQVMQDHVASCSVLVHGDHGQINSALLVADGKIYAGNTILAADKTLNVLSTIENSSHGNSVPCVANGVIFTVMGKSLWAVCDQGMKKPQAGQTKE